jgi:hypothetical protein
MVKVDLAVFVVQGQGVAKREINLDLAHMSAENAKGGSKEILN